MRKAVSPCMFCTEEEKCPTHAQDETVPKKRKPKAARPATPPRDTSSTSAPPPAPSETSSIESSSDEVFQMGTKRKRLAKRTETLAESRELTQEELIFREAVRNLEPLLSSQEKMRQRDILNPPKSPALARQAAELRKKFNEQT